MEGTKMFYQRIALGAMILGLAGVLPLGSAFAQDPDGRDVAPPSEPVARNVGIPACLAKLDLSEQQGAQIKEIIKDYDQDLTMVWKQFGDRYMDTIQTEALLLTAIEDNLTDVQREQVRSQRRKTAHHQKSLESTDDKPNQATSKPASAVEEEIGIVGVALTAQQQVATDGLQGKYLGQLRSLNRDIEGLHIQLVSLEADKIVEIEKVLTKEQLLKLREIRQDYPAASKVAAREALKRPARTE
jgi:hypothetical protein